MDSQRWSTVAVWGCFAVAVVVGCQAEPAPAPTSVPKFDARALAVEERIATIGRGIEDYKKDVGRFPSKLEDLFRSEAKGWRGPYVRTGPAAAPGAPAVTVEQQLTDLWGNRFKYEAGPDSAKVVSCGPDGKEGTSDDLVVTVPKGPSISPPSSGAEPKQP
ncbi:MAG: type II secretion system protein GspG [Thermoguttaceae bacterium]|nr:type II secretion system protein GspG [Thermoguttaceae bacterium]